LYYACDYIIVTWANWAWLLSVRNFFRTFLIVINIKECHINDIRSFSYKIMSYQSTTLCLMFTDPSQTTPVNYSGWAHVARNRHCLPTSHSSGGAHSGELKHRLVATGHTTHATPTTLTSTTSTGPPERPLNVACRCRKPRTHSMRNF